MHIDILTTFPDMFSGPFSESIIDRAQKKKIVDVSIHNLRDWTTDKHRTTDDHPYGGGPGMVMMVGPIDKALASLGAKKGTTNQKIILTSAKGQLYTQTHAKLWSTSLQRIIIICGHYEGVDDRVAQYLVDEEISIGQYVLTGGELAAMVIVDSVVRLLPGALGAEESLHAESHNEPGYLEYPQFTRPENYNGMVVPEVLTKGDHKAIENWKKEQSKG